MNKASTTTKPGFQVKQLALTGLMSAVICILAPISFQIPVSPVPISLGFLGIYFVVSVAGMKIGTISVVIYILLGLAGLPVFTGFTGGPGKLFGPTGGYIVGYLFMALICGYFIDRWGNRILLTFAGMLIGTCVCYLFGTVWLAFQSSYTFPEALAAGVLPYIPFDLVKLVLAATLGRELRTRLKKADLL